MVMFTSGGMVSRGLNLMMQNKKVNENLLGSGIWVGLWSALGYSFHTWKVDQENKYVTRLQFLVDRKERRDKWDTLYFENLSK